MSKRAKMRRRSFFILQSTSNHPLPENTASSLHQKVPKNRSHRGLPKAGDLRSLSTRFYHTQFLIDRIYPKQHLIGWFIAISSMRIVNYSFQNQGCLIINKGLRHLGNMNVKIFRQNQALSNRKDRSSGGFMPRIFFPEQRRCFCVMRGRREGKNGNEQKSENEEKKLFHPAEHFKPPLPENTASSLHQKDAQKPIASPVCRKPEICGASLPFSITPSFS